MASKTIKISPIPENCTEQDIKNALNDSTITRILIKKSQAYVELDSQDGIDVLEFTCPDNRLYQLGDTVFQRVNSDFSWDSLSSDSSSAQQLKEDQGHFQKMEEHIVDLTQPAVPNLITISNCDVTILSSLTEKDLKSTVFSQYSSINRVLKRGNKVIIQFQDPAQTQKLEVVFPGLKIPGLGSQAFVDLDAQDVTAFSSEWIQQHNQQAELASQKEEKHVLHEEIIPKFEKLTSMESDFLKSQQSSGAKVENRFQDITQNSSEHVHTKNQLQANQGFILNEQPERQEIFIGITNEEEEAEKKRIEEQQVRRKVQEERKIQERLILEKQQREIQEQQRQEREKQQRQRIQRQRQERQRQDRERQQKERAEKQKAENERRQQQRIENQRLEKERVQRQRAQRQRIQAENKQKQRKQKQQQQKIREAVEKEQIQRKLLEQHMRIQREKQQEQRRRRMKLAQQQKKKLQQEAEKKRLEEERIAKQAQEKRKQQQLDARKSQQFVLTQEQPKPRQNEEPFINNTGSETLNNQLLSQPKVPLIFWSVVLLALFALLLI